MLSALGWTKNWVSKAPFAFAVALGIACTVPHPAQAGQKTLRFTSEYLVETWETENGLPENSATAIAQTPDGYLWFGTFNGLVRFNGVEFTVLNPANTPGLPSAGIVNLHLDRRGRLWVSTYRGLVVRNGEQWRSLNSEDGWKADYARTFSERANGDILICAFNGKLFEYSADRLTELPPPPGDGGQGYFGGVDEDGHWWAVQNKFIGRLENGRWVRMIAGPEQDKDAVGCAPARDGGLWVLLGVELRKFRRGSEVARINLSERPGRVWSVSEDGDGNVWIATHDQGICRVTPEGKTTRWNAANGGSDRGRFVFEDRERNLWLGTSGDGLARLAPQRFQFFDLDGGRKGQLVQSVWPDSGGGLWAGTYGRGLFHLDEAGVTSTPLPSAITSLPYVRSVLLDRKGRLWVGTLDDAVWVVEHGGAHHWSRDQTGGRNIHAFFEDSRGRVWVSGGSSIAVYDGNRFQGFGPEQGLPTSTVTSFDEDPEGAVWLTNGAGLFRVDREGKLTEVKDSAGQAIRGISCLKADTDGAVWLGSDDRGLLRWKEGALTEIGGSSGFPVSEIRGFVEDQEGFFWVTSLRSVVRTRRSELQAVADGRKARLTCQVFDANDGLPSGEFTPGRQPTAVRDAKGRLWFAMTKGVAMTDPAKLQLNDVPPPVHVEGISYYRSLPPETQHGGKDPARVEVPTVLRGPFATPVSLPAGSHRIEVQYAGLCFAAPEKVRYQIKLEGQDRDWQDVGNRRVAYYHALSPRDYVFRVRAANNDGVWNEIGTSLAFTVLPFYWQTNWFRLLAVLGLAGGAAGSAWAVVRGRLRRHRAELAHHRALAESQKRVDLTVTAANLGIWERDMVGLQIWASDQWRAVYGFEKSVALDLELVLERIHPEDREAVRQLYTGKLRDRAGYSVEYRIVLPDSRVRWIASRGLVEVDDAGKPVLMRGVSIDITDRKRTEQALREQQNELAHLSRATLLGELGGALAHELNQPLAAMVNNAAAGRRFIAKGRGDVQKLDKLLEEVSADGRRAGEILQGIRAMIRRGDDERSPFDLNAAAAEILKLAGPDALGRGCALVAEFDSALTPVNGIRVQIQQVFLNLILNALDAVEHGPPELRRVILQTQRRADGRVEVSVRDFGEGLPKEDPERVFKPFVTTKRNGMGLGLAIARSIVEAHGGRITAINAEGGGACFSFWLSEETTPGSENDSPSSANGDLAR